MSSISLRLFLVVLLGIDWAVDPFHGTSPSSRPLASTEVVCRSIQLSAELVSEVSPVACPYMSEQPVDALQPLFARLAQMERTIVLSGVDLAYLFMSMQN